MTDREELASLREELDHVAESNNMIRAKLEEKEKSLQAAEQDNYYALRERDKWMEQCLAAESRAEAAEAEALLWENRAMEAGYAHECGGYKPQFVESLQAEVERLKGIENTLQNLYNAERVATNEAWTENESLQAEVARLKEVISQDVCLCIHCNDVLDANEDNCCVACDLRASQLETIPELKSEVARLENLVDSAYMRGCEVSKQAWRRDGAEAALRWAWNYGLEGPAWYVIKDEDQFVDRGIRAVCGRGE